MDMTVDEKMITLQLIHGDSLETMTEGIVRYSNEKYTYVINIDGIELFKLDNKKSLYWKIDGPFIILRDIGENSGNKIYHVGTMFIADIELPERVEYTYNLESSNIGKNIWCAYTSNHHLKDMYLVDSYMHDLKLELQKILENKYEYTKIIIRSIILLSESVKETVINIVFAVINHRVYTSYNKNFIIDIESGKINMEE